jgi:ketosteroid isomerase-like protein
MNKDNQKTVALQFNEYINNRDIFGLENLMTANHSFIDSGNNMVLGKDKVLEAWKRFFELFPDYRNEFENVRIQNDFVIITGHSSCSDKRLDGRAIWKIKIEENKIAEWRVYDDTPPNRRELGIK